MAMKPSLRLSGVFPSHPDGGPAPGSGRWPAAAFMMALFAGGLLLISSSRALAGDAPAEIPKNSALRAQLFDLARPKVEKQVGQPAKFHGSLKKLGDWAFFQGEIVDAKGNPIVLPVAESAEACVLWKKNKDGWKLVQAYTGITDVAWQPWPEEYGVPAKLLGLENYR